MNDLLVIKTHVNNAFGGY